MLQRLTGLLTTRPSLEVDPVEDSETVGTFTAYETSALRGSVIRLAERAPSVDVACVGHGTPLTTGGSGALSALAREVRYCLRTQRIARDGAVRLSLSP